MSIPLPFHSYRLRSPKAAQTRLLNCYALVAPPEGKSPTIIQGIAGIRAFAEIDKSPQRAAIQFNGVLHCVAGNGFYRVEHTGTATLLGELPTGPIDIAKNTGQIAILIDERLWVYDGSSLVEVDDADFTARGAARMAVMDNYGGFIEPQSGRFFICDLNDFTVYDSLDFATAEGAPDNLLSIESNQRQFVLFGEESIELWDNIGGSGFPFERVSNGFVENGLGAPRGTCSADNTVFWIDQDRLARRLEGNTPRRISYDGVEQQWQQYSSIEDCEVFSYVHDGHTFVVYAFPDGTWVHDINTGEWHERKSYGYGYYRAAWVVKCYGKTLVGDTESGNIGEINSDTYSEWGDVLYREATTAAVPGRNRWINFDRLELSMEVGRGIETGQGSDPEVMLDVSNDGGVTFRAKTSRKLGTAGQFAKTVHWDRLGRAKRNHRVFRFRVTDPVPFVVSDAQLDAR